MANNLSDFLENALVKLLFRGVSYSVPATVYLALYTTAAGETLTGAVEVTGANYSRKLLTTSPTGSSSFTDPGTGNSTSNTGVQTFPTAGTNGWGTIVGVGLLDASSTGNLLWYGPLSANRAVMDGDTFSFNANDLSFALD